MDNDMGAPTADQALQADQALCNKLITHCGTRRAQPACLQQHPPRLQKPGGAPRLLPRVRARRACPCPFSPRFPPPTAWQEAQTPFLLVPVAQESDATQDAPHTKNTPKLEKTIHQTHPQQTMPSQCHARMARQWRNTRHMACRLHTRSLLCVVYGAQNLSSSLGLRGDTVGLLLSPCKLLEGEG